MIRQTVNLGHMQYVVDMFDAYTDNVVHYDEFVMIRNYDIVNGVFDDKDLYFIERSIWDTYVFGGGSLIWPTSEKRGGGFSLNYRMYNDFLSVRTMASDIDVYHIYDKYKQPSKIRCNKVRIYPPTVKSFSDVIVHIDNFINNIHVHYFCQPFYSQVYNSETEFSINNYFYSQYIELYFPNVYDLFGNDKKRTHSVHYFIDKLHELDYTHIYDKYDNPLENNYLYDEDGVKHGKIASEEQYERPDKGEADINFYIDADKYEDDTQEEIIPIHDKIYAIHDVNTNEVYVPLSIYSLSYKIEEYYVDDEFEGFKKRYLTNAKSIENNYITYPVNVVLFPISEVVNSNFVLDESTGIATSTFMTELKISLSAKLGFHNNVPSIVTYFKYPDVYKFDTFLDAYKFYNNVRTENYNDINLDTMEKLFHDIDACTSITDEDKHYTIEYFRRNHPSKHLPNFDENHALLDLYKEMKKEVIYKELEESMETTFDFLGFRVIVASDVNFKNIVFENNFKVDFKDLDDFSFALNDIFANWNEVHEGLYIAKVIFIDRFLGTQIISNTVLLTNEWIKFMMDTVNYRVAPFNNLNDDILSKYKNNDITYEGLRESFKFNEKRYTIMNNAEILGIPIDDYLSYLNDPLSEYYNPDLYVDTTENTIFDDMNFYFLENMKCVVEERVEGNESVNIQRTTGPKVLYRPLFYKTNDLQNVRIRANMIQNIGINLAEYMTKVNIFKLLLNGVEYTEYARNDSFVIFKVNGSGFKTQTGMYDIKNENDDYISSGRWTLY